LVIGAQYRSSYRSSGKVVVTKVLKIYDGEIAVSSTKTAGKTG
jgi:hypothetical protein